MEGMDRIQSNIRALRDRLLAAAADAADESAHLLSSYAKAIAPWTDRTQNLRGSINAKGTVEGNVARITVFETMTYAPWVEGGTSRSRAYPSLWPSVAANADRVLQTFQRHMKL